jgi:hypothetical protein
MHQSVAQRAGMHRSGVQRRGMHRSVVQGAGMHRGGAQRGMHRSVAQKAGMHRSVPQRARMHLQRGGVRRGMRRGARRGMPKGVRRGIPKGVPKEVCRGVCRLREVLRMGITSTKWNSTARHFNAVYFIRRTHVPQHRLMLTGILRLTSLRDTFVWFPAQSAKDNISVTVGYGRI